MLPWTLLDTATIPGDGGEMRLHQRGNEYSIRVDNYELMSSREHGSEDALASLALERLRGRKAMRVLIGGLGMGYTLIAVLDEVARDAEVVVSELVPAVVQWHRGPLRGVSKGALDDPRVIVRETDVAQIIREAPNAWDAILLDVDNGPRALTAKGNDRLYSRTGLRAAHGALRPSGILGIWSSGADPSFTKRLQQSQFQVEEKWARARGGKGAKYLIWIAQRA